MNITGRGFLSTLLIFVFLSGGSLFGDGVVITHDNKTGRPVPLTIKNHHVDVTIDNQVAITKIEQVFKNHTNRRLEGEYIFPVPEGASISNFSMLVDGKQMKAEVLSREEAQKIYRNIVRRRKDPALLQYVGQKAIKASVFPIQARGERKIEITYEEMLRKDSGMVQYRYPLNTEKFSAKPLEHVSVEVTVQSDRPIQTVHSPFHEIDVVRKDGVNTVVVGYEESNVKPEKDFLLYYSQSDESYEIKGITYNDAGRPGYFSLLISPHYEQFRKKPVPKDLVFLIDKSGSMRHDSKIEQASQSLNYCIKNLNQKDRFGIITFGTAANSFRNHLLTASKKAKTSAEKFIQSIGASGGTNIYQALDRAFRMKPKKSDRPYLIVLLTDGNPTVGEITDPQKILEKVEGRSSEGIRIFSVGVGNDVKTGFLDRLTEQNHGERTYVSPEEGIERKVSNLYNKISNPVLSDVRIDIKGVRTKEMYPVDLPDLFLGSQLVLYGRYEKSGSATVILRGKRAGQNIKKVYELNFSEQNMKYDYLPRLWANTKIGNLIDHIRLHGVQKELKDEVVRLSKEYGIITPYTAHLIAKEEEMKGDGISSVQERLRRENDRIAKKAEGYRSGGAGEKAQRASEHLQKQKQGNMKNLETESTVQNMIRQVGAKTFYQSGKTWTDQAVYSANKKYAKTVEYLSDEYFELLEKHPELGKYFSLGEQVEVLWNNQKYRVVSQENGSEK